MKNHLLCYHNNENKAIVCQVGYEIDKHEIKWNNEFTIPDSDFNNRIMLDAKGKLLCYKIGDELSCSIYPPTGLLPKMCHIDRQGKRICGYDFIRENPDAFISAVIDLAKFEKIRPDLVKWMIDEGVQFVYDYKTENLGWAKCDSDFKEIGLSPQSFHPVITIAHEIAHCKEQIARKRKGLPPMYAKWEIKDKKLIPIGGEERATKFGKRIEKKQKIALLKERLREKELDFPSWFVEV